MLKTPSVICRDIALRNVRMTVYFWYYAPYEATREDPGFEGEIEIESIFVDEFNVLGLFGESSLAEVEKELWKLLEEGEEV